MLPCILGFELLNMARSNYSFWSLRTNVFELLIANLAEHAKGSTLVSGNMANASLLEGPKKRRTEVSVLAKRFLVIDIL